MSHGASIDHWGPSSTRLKIHIGAVFDTEREGAREGGRQGRRQGGKEGGMEGGREGDKEGGIGKERWSEKESCMVNEGHRKTSGEKWMGQMNRRRKWKM